jgi:hypothetical protein
MSAVPSPEASSRGTIRTKNHDHTHGQVDQAEDVGKVIHADGFFDGRAGGLMGCDEVMEGDGRLSVVRSWALERR